MSKRIHSIDSLRTIAIFFVIIAHASPFKGVGTYGDHIFFILDTIGQFDVPFFFVASGYFFAKKVNQNNVLNYITNVVRKLGSLYLFGILCSLVVVASIELITNHQFINAVVQKLVENNSLLKMVYYGGSISWHLWFLTALIFCLIFVSIFVICGKERYVLPVAAIAHAFGILSQNYPMIFDVSYPTRDALFFGFFYVALGFHIRSSDWKPNKDRSRLYLGAFCVIMVIQLLEQYAIAYLIRGVPFDQIYFTEYTIATTLLVSALFIYALSNPDLGKGTILPDLGEYAVGVFILHLPLYRVIEALNDIVSTQFGINPRSTILWHLAIVPLLYVLSLAIYLLMAKLRIIELGGSHIPWLSYIRTRFQTADTDKGVTAD